MIKPRLILDKIKPHYDSPEAIIITGMRRTGKTTLLNLIFSHIQSANKIFLDLENPLNRKYFEQLNYEQVKSSLEVLGIDFTRKAYIFLDEFLFFKDSALKIPENPWDITRPVFESISPLYDEYLRFGGFPGVVLKTNASEKAMALDDIFTSYFQWEVLQLGDFRKNAMIRDLIVLLAQRVGSKLDIQKISKELGITRPTLYEYLAFLEGTFFIKLIRPYTRSRNSEIRKSHKVYLCDTGLANRLANLDEGRIFATSLFQNLRIKGEIEYYERKNGAEIDFLLDKTHAFEAKMTPQHRDVNQLKRVAEELGMTSWSVVSRNFTNLESTIYGFQI